MINSKNITVLIAVLLSGCAAEVNQQVDMQLKNNGLIETREQLVHGEKDKTLSCINKSDEAFNIKFNAITETTLSEPLQYIPIINLAGGFLQTDTKYQTITYNNETSEYVHLGTMKIDNQNIDVYRNNWGFTKNRGNLLYLYSSNDKVIHAFRTETGVIPKLSSFYSCR
ncbi:hypothetical protein [Citrobacter portucalensis]|uniref:hypothetical protein n=1 Tax=Citrobacter portucalensis TaxID=1639133 RepID=UPI00254BA2BA|nr:hypothetical protein [Citrobacter portucalensis]